MRIRLNDQDIRFPSSLSEFTLGQRIDFYHQYGKQLDEMLASILSMEEGMDREMESMQLQVEKMFATFAFFAGTTPEALKESAFVDDIAAIYFSCIEQLFQDEQAIEPQQLFIWKGEEWELHPPELKQGSRMTFGELIESKQIIHNLVELGAGNIERLLPLCAIYLRRKGEPFHESFVFEGSDRLQLMRELPMDIALQVGFFLSSSANIYMNIFQSFGPAGSKDPATIARNILSAGVGSTS